MAKARSTTSVTRLAVVGWTKTLWFAPLHEVSA
jgi:hypothetical protein